MELRHTQHLTSLEKSTWPGESIRLIRYDSEPARGTDTVVQERRGGRGERGKGREGRGGKSYLPTLIILQSNGAGFHGDASNLLVFTTVHVAKLRTHRNIVSHT